MKTLMTAFLVVLLMASCSQKDMPSHSETTSQYSALAKNMFSMNASKRIIISTLKEDTTSVNYKVAQRWEKDCICGSVPPSLEDFCEK